MCTEQCDHTSYILKTSAIARDLLKAGYVQLDWPSETVTLKLNFPRDREGYGRFKTTNEKLSLRRIHWCGGPSFIFIFWQLF